MIEEHNQKIREQIFDFVSDLNSDQLNTKAEPGTWSIAQILDHLYLMERAITHQINVTLTHGTIAPTDIKPFHLTLDRSRRIEAPAHVVPSDEPKTLEELQDELNQSRTSFLHVLEGHSDEELTQLSFPHPVFGLMDLKQWKEFIGLHEQRHLEQMREVKEQVLAG